MNRGKSVLSKFELRILTKNVWERSGPTDNKQNKEIWTSAQIYTIQHGWKGEIKTVLRLDFTPYHKLIGAIFKAIGGFFKGLDRSDIFGYDFFLALKRFTKYMENLC